MDGTLVDSETLTEPAIRKFCAENGIEDFDLDCTVFFGGPWIRIEQQLKREFPELNGKSGVATRLNQIYHEMLVEHEPPLIRNARESVIAANALVPTAIVSSSSRGSIEATIRRMEIAASITYYAGAEDFENPKPAPEPYLLAARELRVDVGECLVFEDSIAGIRSAKSAGMQVVAIAHRCNDVTLAGELADGMITDFAQLENSFFSGVCKR